MPVPWLLIVMSRMRALVTSKRWRRAQWINGLGGICVAFSALAGAADSAEWALFPSAQVSERNQQHQRDFEFPLGAIRRELDGHVGPNPSERIAGQKTATTYQVTGSYNTAEIFRFFRDQVAERGYQEKYLCESFQCGRSSFWANNYFGVSNLFGPDRNQHLLAAVLEAAEQHSFVIIYVIERANRRLYYQITEIVTKASQAPGLTMQLPTLMTALEQNSRVALPGLSFDEAGQLTTPADSESLGVIREMLQVLAHRDFVLVGHDRSGQGNLDQQINRSQAMAQNLARKLGAEASQITVRGIGPLAPIQQAPETRWVEVVLME